MISRSRYCRRRILGSRGAVQLSWRVLRWSATWPGFGSQVPRRALESASGRWSDAAAQNPDDPLGAVIGFYLSGDHREEKMDGCPIVALGSDAARQGPDVKAEFEAGVKAHLDVLGRFLAGTDDEASRDKASRDKAMAILATMVGAVTLSRVVNDPDLAQALLDAAAEQVRDAAAA